MLWNVEFILSHSANRTGAELVPGFLGFCCKIRVNWVGFGNGRGRSRTASMAENTALLAPMPSASVVTTSNENPGFLRSCRSAYLRFPVIARHDTCACRVG